MVVDGVAASVATATETATPVGRKRRRLEKLELIHFG
jgi:hypothetical protein